MRYQNYPDAVDGRFFSKMTPEEERLRPVPLGASYEWTETSMFGFNIPEHDIDAIIYIWHHPALRVSSGGIMIWRGRNRNQVECEYSDYRTVMPLPDDHVDWTYPNGLTVKMVKPLEEFRIGFRDEARDTHLDLHLKAVMPPACRHNGGHLTQAMKTSGTLVLNGEYLTIDGFHSRDRSWNEARDESLLPIAPISWTVGIVDENFAFHHLSFDRREYHPEWNGRLVTPQQSCQWGYVWEGGRLHGVTATDQRTTVDPETLAPLRIETLLTATNGRTYHIAGTAGATTQIQCWPNMSGHFALMTWEVEGRGIAYGDVQRCIWRDAWRTMSGKAG